MPRKPKPCPECGGVSCHLRTCTLRYGEYKIGQGLKDAAVSRRQRSYDRLRSDPLGPEGQARADREEGSED